MPAELHHKNIRRSGESASDKSYRNRRQATLSAKCVIKFYATGNVIKLYHLFTKMSRGEKEKFGFSQTNKFTHKFIEKSGGALDFAGFFMYTLASSPEIVDRSTLI